MLYCIGLFLMAFATMVPSAAAYDVAVHFSFTLWLAEMVGFREDDAFDLAKFDWGTDDDPNTTPLPYTPTAGATKRRELYHFVNDARLNALRQTAEACTP